MNPKPRYLRILSERQSYYKFDTFNGHIYYHHGKSHECRYLSIANHFDFKIDIEKCSVTLESGKDHLHDPLPRWILSRIILLWSAKLEILNSPLYFNGSTGIRVALHDWERVVDVGFPLDTSLDSFSNHCKVSPALSPYSYSFNEVLGQKRLEIAKEFLFSTNPTYWGLGVLAEHPAIFGKFLCFYLLVWCY